MLQSIKEIPLRVARVLRYTRFAKILIKHCNRFLNIRVEPSYVAKIVQGESDLTLDFTNFQRVLFGDEQVTHETQTVTQNILDASEDVQSVRENYTTLLNDLLEAEEELEELEALYDSTNATLDDISTSGTPIVKLWDGVTGSNTDIDLTVTTAQNITSGKSSVGAPQMAYTLITKSPHDPVNDVIAQAGPYAVTGALPLFKTGWNGVTEFNWRVADWVFKITPTETATDTWKIDCTVVAPST